ncbi:MAG: hypothetical protein C4527_08755 [Candidatus Omnitrophota bacterium]|jgi:predicted transcriptional regulator|nr:MAG: hypothetical protein C4527_08755 [Candidatus Omnitrophota bacterium]
MKKSNAPIRMDAIPADLPDAEMEVMACLWKFGRATARQINEAMGDYRPMAHGSTVTLLNRLEAKGLVKKEKGDRGKAFLYKPTRRPTPTYRHVVGKLVQRIFGGDSLALVSSLFQTKPPTNAELDDLQQLLDQLKREAKEKDK